MNDKKRNKRRRKPGNSKPKRTTYLLGEIIPENVVDSLKRLGRQAEAHAGEI